MGSCIADFSWTFSLPCEAGSLSKAQSALVQHALRAYATARDSEEANGANLAEKLQRVKLEVGFSASLSSLCGSAAGRPV